VRDIAKKLTVCTTDTQQALLVGSGGLTFWEPAADEFADARAFLQAQPDASLDAVVSFLAILHIAGKDELFRELHRVLKPGGRLVFEDLVITRSEPTLEAERACGDRGESKLQKADRVVFLQEPQTIASYTQKLAAAGFSGVGVGAPVVDAAPTWKAFVRDRREGFAAYGADTPLQAMGIGGQGTLGEALAQPGVYISGSTGDGTSYTQLDSAVRADDFNEPAGSILKPYLHSQLQFVQEVHEVFNVDGSVGGVWVFAEKA